MRTLLTAPILFGVSIMSFVLMRLLPGDFSQVLVGLGNSVPPDVIARIKKTLGINLPIWEQYKLWLVNALQGDLGISFNTGRAVSPELWSRLLVTLQLTATAAVIALLIGVTTGILSARVQGKTEKIIRNMNSLIIGVPSFVVATLIVLMGGLYFQSISLFNYVSFSESPIDSFKYMFLPSISLALAMSVNISENMRAAILETASQDFVMLAKASGLRARTILWKHLIRNSLTPVITVFGLQLAALLGGSVVIESIFRIPGLGQLLFDSVNNRDYPVIQGIVLMVAFIVLIVNLLVDIAYAKADSRVKYE